ncbi:MAG: TRAP transporter substrate-binding protein DctP [Burkholderiales bacterium]
MKRTARWLSGFAFVALLPWLAAAPAAAQQPIELKVASSFAKNSVWETGFFMFVDRVNEKAKGRLKLNYVGGPEAIPAFQLTDAARSGVVDIASGVGSYMSSVVPEGDAMKLSQLTPAEERANGTYALLQKIIAQKAGVEYLGRFNTPGVHFYFYTVNKIDKIDDFKGQKLRVAPLYRAFALKLGTSPVTMPHSEIFAALERGVVTGLGFGGIDFTRNGFQKFIKYIVEPAFYSNDQCILVNQATWQKLPPDLQKLLTETMIEVERDSAKATEAEAAKERATMLAAGMQVVQVQDPKRYLEMAYEEGWKEVLAKTPENGAQLRKLMSKP